jgi:Xaa-Pro aminopeptidase
MTVARHRWLERALGGATTLEPVERLVESVRLCKDAYEVGVFRAAGRLISEVADRVIGEVRAGQAERDLALEIDSQMRKAGFERPAFETIVASGPNSALPHARPTTRRISEGDLVVLDFGGVYASYCVDLTRTIHMGRASARAREVHAAVLEAHDRAIAAVAPGRLRFDVDGAARDALAGRGMADAFGHGTGHGLGVEVHEEPRISRRPPAAAGGDEQQEPGDALVPGMVFTIEPGAYFAGFGGVRIEDDVLVTAAGAEVLTSTTTALVEI